MKKSYDLDLFYTMLVSNMDDLELETDFPSYFYQGLYDGVNQLKYKQKTESKRFDDKWITTIASYLPSLDKIVRNYKSILRTDEEVVIIEKAKKTDASTVKHLAANTHLLKPGRNSQDVRPKKLLVKQHEIDYAIYENRFIMSLIQRLSQFISTRQSRIEKEIYTKRYSDFDSNTEFNLDDYQYQIRLDIQEVEILKKDKNHLHNTQVLERAQHLAKQISGYHKSAFMQVMKGQKSVSSPIMKTQIIQKNVDYRNCYLLWVYLDQATDLSYELTVNEKGRRFDYSYQKHLNQVTLFALSTVLYHDQNRKESEKLQNLRKQIKQSRAQQIKPENINIKPESYRIEDARINEYYLNKIKQIFKKTLDQYVESETRYDLALKKALKDTIEVTNSLYASYFDINQEQDVFARLIKESDPKDALEEAQSKFRIAQMIREVKESDYNQAITLEKKWYQTLLSKQKTYLKEMEDDTHAFVKQETKKVKQLHNDVLSLERKKVLEDKKVRLANNRKELIELKHQFKQKYVDQVNKLEEKRRTQLKREKEKAQANLKAAKEKLKQQQTAQKQKEKTILKQQKEKVKSAHQRAVQKLKDNKTLGNKD